MTYAPTWLAGTISHFLGQGIATLLMALAYMSKVTITELVVRLVNFNTSLVCGALLYYAMERMIRQIVLSHCQEEDELRNWKALVDGLPVGLLITHKSSLIYSNPALMAILGIEYEKRKPLDESWQPTKHSEVSDSSPEDNIKHKLRSVTMQGTEGSRTQVTLYQVLFEDMPVNEAASGGKYTYQIGESKALSLTVNFMTFRSGAESHKVVLIQDVSVFEELEREKMYLKYQKTFFAMITHELRNPLHGLMGVLEVLKGADISPDNASLCTLGINTGKLMMCLVHDILDISQMEANKFKLNNEAFSPGEAAKECASVMQYRFEEKKISLRLRLMEKLPSTIVADKMRYKQILFNLLGNSLKFTKEGYVEIQLSYDREFKKLITSVHDTGVGMTQEEQRKLFQMYTRIEAHSSINQQGTSFTLSFRRRPWSHDMQEVE